MYIQIVISILVVFAVPDAANVVKRNEGCRELLECVRFINRYGVEDILGVTMPYDDPAYDPINGYIDDYTFEDFCHANTDFKTCFDTKKDRCNDVTTVNTVKGPVEAFLFLCSDAGYVVFLRVLDARCYTEGELHSEVEECFSECQQAYHDSFASASLNATLAGQPITSVNYCPYVSQLISCTTSSLTEICDNVFATFAVRFWKIANKPLYGQMGCAALFA